MSFDLSNLVPLLSHVAIHVVWEAIAIFIILRLILMVMRRRSPQLRHVIACLAMAAIPTAAFLTAWNDAAQDAARARVDAIEPVAAWPVAKDQAIGAHPGPLMPYVRGGVRYDPASQPNLVDRIILKTEPYFPVIISLWGGGVFVLCLSHLSGMISLRRLRLSATKLDAGVERQLQALAKIVCPRRVIRLLQVDMAWSPFTFGTWRPVIILPVSVVTGFSPADLEALIAHELAHIRRMDFLMRQLQAVIETLFFFHPCIWMVSRVVDDTREQCCDHEAGRLCGSPKRYAVALVRFADAYNLARPPTPSIALSGGHLLQRIKVLAENQNVSQRGAATSLAASLTCVVCVATLTLSLLGAAHARRDRVTTARLMENEFVLPLLGVTDSTSNEFDTAYADGLQAALERASTSDARIERLASVASVNVDTKLVWSRFLSLVGPSSYPSVRSEFPSDWNFADVHVHRRLINLLWKLASDRVGTLSGRQAAIAALALGTMRREESCAEALRRPLTDDHLSEISGLAPTQIQRLRTYWSDSYDLASRARVDLLQVAEHARPGLKFDEATQSALERITAVADRFPDCGYAGFYLARQSGFQIERLDVKASGDIFDRISASADSNRPSRPAVLDQIIHRLKQ